MRNPITSLRERFRSAPISCKLLSIVLACSLLSVGLITGSSLYREYKHLIEHELDSLKTIAQIVSSSADAALRFEDQETAQAILSALENQRSMICCQIVRANGTVFAEYKCVENCDLDLRDANTITGTIFAYSQPITIAGQSWGTIVLRSDASAFRQDLIYSIALHALILAVSLVASLLLAKRLLPAITDPVTELATLAKKVSEDRKYDLRAIKRHDDEIGTLVDSVNFMLSTVRKREKEISDTNRNLESLVADRTVKLIKAREKAEAAAEAKSIFLSTVSHEVRTPLNAIIGMCSVLQTEGLDPNRTRQLEVIQRSASSLLLLINDILDFSRIEANRLDLENVAFDLVACVEDSLAIAAAAKRNNRIVSCSTFSPDLPAYLLGDAARIRQILINLLHNAFKFTDRGSVTVEAQLIASSRSRKERLQITIRDTGIGIPESRLKSIFESFTQASESTSRQFGGTGLGLTISHRIAQAMGGDIKAESEEGTGSAFTLTLPLKRVAGQLASICDPLPVSPPLKVQLLSLPTPLDASLRTFLLASGCQVLGENEQHRTEADLKIASALVENEFGAVEIAGQLEASERTLLLCHPDHSVLLQKANAATILALPVGLRDLRKALLKLAKTDERTAPSPATPFASHQREKWRQLRVLLAEDNELSRSVFQHHMELIGLDIDTAENGEEACALALQVDYDLIFMDVRMPKRDGLEAAQFLRKSLGSKRPQPWIIGFTANTEAEALLEIEKAGMNDYLSKPAAIHDIVDSVNRFFLEKGGSSTSFKDA